MFTYPCETLHNYQNTFMHKSEPGAHLTIITSAKVSLEQESLGPIGVWALFESNSKVDSTSYYKESIELQYPM